MTGMRDLISPILRGDLNEAEIYGLKRLHARPLQPMRSASGLAIYQFGEGRWLTTRSRM